MYVCICSLLGFLSTFIVLDEIVKIKGEKVKELEELEEEFFSYCDNEKIKQKLDNTISTQVCILYNVQYILIQIHRHFAI